MALEEIGGFTVHTCPDGIAALEKAKEIVPDLILLDWMMPGMNGGSTLEKLRETDETRDIPVVFMTARVRPEEKARMIELGAIDVIAKPFDPIALPERIREIWGCHRASSGGPSDCK
jgi:DNA-binding response OmpR family regulator